MNNLKKIQIMKQIKKMRMSKNNLKIKIKNQKPFKENEIKSNNQINKNFQKMLNKILNNLTLNKINKIKKY